MRFAGCLEREGHQHAEGRDQELLLPEYAANEELLRFTVVANGECSSEGRTTSEESLRDDEPNLPYDEYNESFNEHELTKRAFNQ